ncbi:hypothetical protein VNO80_09760 [Phaseolus coccineus]|uniref:Uncharacterized protein n=1 Tax=Phaseolus coccineus TaxID=3886 RepID=A0AAN9RD36_PHACN
MHILGSRVILLNQGGLLMQKLLVRLEDNLMRGQNFLINLVKDLSHSSHGGAALESNDLTFIFGTRPTVSNHDIPKMTSTPPRYKLLQRRSRPTLTSA